jgi:hypothetical protein
MGSADCETTSEIVSDSSLPALPNFGPSAPALGPFLCGGRRQHKGVQKVGEARPARWRLKGACTAPLMATKQTSAAKTARALTFRPLWRLRQNTGGSRLPCRIIWRKENRIGIAFD